MEEELTRLEEATEIWDDGGTLLNEAKQHRVKTKASMEAMLPSSRPQPGLCTSRSPGRSEEPA